MSDYVQLWECLKKRANLVVWNEPAGFGDYVGKILYDYFQQERPFRLEELLLYIQTRMNHTMVTPAIILSEYIPFQGRVTYNREIDGVLAMLSLRQK